MAPQSPAHPLTDLLLSLAIAALAGCAAAPAGLAPIQPPATPAAALSAQEQRLAALFAGTPVLVSMRPDGSLRVELPLRYCFDSARAAIKPPFAALLDEIAKGQADRPTQIVLTAPLDAGAADAALGLARDKSARQYLVGRGIAESRIGATDYTISGWMRIVVRM